jgi:hypothetical protein
MPPQGVGRAAGWMARVAAWHGRARWVALMSRQAAGKARRAARLLLNHEAAYYILPLDPAAAGPGSPCQAAPRGSAYDTNARPLHYARALQSNGHLATTLQTCPPSCHPKHLAAPAPATAATAAIYSRTPAPAPAPAQPQRQRQQRYRQGGKYSPAMCAPEWMARCTSCWNALGLSWNALAASLLSGSSGLGSCRGRGASW